MNLTLQDLISNLPNVLLNNIGPNQVILQLAHDEAVGGTPIYYSKHGMPTSSRDDAYVFSSTVEAAVHAESFRRAVAIDMKRLDDKTFRDPEPVSFVVMFVNNKPGIPPEFYNVPHGWTTTILDNATRFGSPSEAAVFMDQHKTVIGGEAMLGNLSVVPYESAKRSQHSFGSEIKTTVLDSKHAPISEDGQAMAPLNLDELGAAPDKQYIIRFVDPEAANDIEGDLSAPCWVRYYCEGSLVRSMEAAEWFDQPGDAGTVFNLLRNAVAPLQLFDADAALMLKLQVLATLVSTASTKGAQLTFKHGVLIQILAVTVTEAGGYEWETFLQDGYPWIYEDEVMEEEEENQP